LPLLKSYAPKVTHRKLRAEVAQRNLPSPGGQRTALSAFPVGLNDPGWQAQAGQPYFSPHSSHGERFWVPNLDLNCRRWHPAKTPGVLRIASSVLHILPQTTVAPESGAPEARGRKAAQEHFSEESFRTQTQSRNAFLKSSTTSPRQYSAETHGLQQAWINSRNQTTIATRAKHRQPMFLHPTANAGQPIVEGEAPSAC
jgi:hypothetical protein